MQHARGEIALYFFDASGFSLTPSVPYAWQPIGEWIEVPSTKSQRVNALGFLSPCQSLHPFVFEGSVDTQAVIACFDAFCRTLTRPSWGGWIMPLSIPAALYKARIPQNLFKIF